MGMKRTSAVLLLTLAACSSLSPVVMGKEGAMIKKKEFFARIDALAKIEKVRPDGAAKALGLALEFRKDEKNRDLDVYEATPPAGSWATRVEVRVSKNDAPGGLVIVDVDARLGIKSTDLLARLGKNPRIDSPSDNAPADSPKFYVYPQKGQALSFALKDGKPQALVSVVLDRP